MVAGLPKGHALKMLKKLSKNSEKMVAGRPVTIFIAFSFELSTNRGGGLRPPPKWGRRPSAAAPILGSLFVDSSKENIIKMVTGLPATIFSPFLTTFLASLGRTFSEGLRPFFPHV